jgi:F0F1-type ATP synthase delta subunit
MNLSALNPYLKTKNEANELIIVLEKLNEGIFKENFNLSELLTTITTYDLKTALEKFFQTESVGKSGGVELKSFILSLQKEINSLPVIHIILSFPASENTISYIHDWFYENYKRIVLLDISVDKSIIAGSVISYNGRAQDYSLATKIGQMQI